MASLSAKSIRVSIGRTCQFNGRGGLLNRQIYTQLAPRQYAAISSSAGRVLHADDFVSLIGSNGHTGIT